MKYRRDPSRTFLGSWIAAALVLGCSPRPEAPADPQLGSVMALGSVAVDALETWPLKLENVVLLLEERLDQAETQGAMHRAASNLYAVYDALLKDRFALRLAAATEEGERLALVQEMREWRAGSVAVADEAAQEFEGGSLAPFAYSMALLGETRRRYEDMR
ncbi:MAG: lysozyme inhibitor LprI family protein [Planctomycetota bacterium]